MFRQLLYLHWKTVRPGIALLSLLCFGLPLVTVQGLGAFGSPVSVMMSGLPLVTMWQPVYPLLAAILGATLALSAWSWDHRGDHVYALALPLPRWQLSLVKLLGGALLLLVPVAALWLGAWLAIASLDLPSWLHGYPHALTGRFLLAALLAYALLFAMAASTIRTTVRVLIGLVVALVAGEVLVALLAEYDPAFENVGFFGMILEWSVQRAGPLRIFTGNWMLVDV